MAAENAKLRCTQQAPVKRDRDDAEPADANLRDIHVQVQFERIPLQRQVRDADSAVIRERNRPIFEVPTGGQARREWAEGPAGSEAGVEGVAHTGEHSPNQRGRSGNRQMIRARWSSRTRAPADGTSWGRWRWWRASTGRNARLHRGRWWGCSNGHQQLDLVAVQ